MDRAERLGVVARRIFSIGLSPLCRGRLIGRLGAVARLLLALPVDSFDRRRDVRDLRVQFEHVPAAGRALPVDRAWVI